MKNLTILDAESLDLALGGVRAGAALDLSMLTELVKGFGFAIEDERPQFVCGTSPSNHSSAVADDLDEEDLVDHDLTGEEIDPGYGVAAPVSAPTLEVAGASIHAPGVVAEAEASAGVRAPGIANADVEIRDHREVVVRDHR
jgi:hypothetical protein